MGCSQWGLRMTVRNVGRAPPARMRRKSAAFQITSASATPANERLRRGSARAIGSALAAARSPMKMSGSPSAGSA